MKVAVFFVYLCFHLLGGGNYLHADTHRSSISDSSVTDLAKKEQANLTNSHPGNALIDDADLDLDEEYHSGDDIKVGSQKKFLVENHHLVNNWYSAFSGQSNLNYYPQHFKIFAPFCANSNPIYIRIRVLRI